MPFCIKPHASPLCDVLLLPDGPLPDHVCLATACETTRLLAIDRWDPELDNLRQERAYYFLTEHWPLPASGDVIAACETDYPSLFTPTIETLYGDGSRGTLVGESLFPDFQRAFPSLLDRPETWVGLAFERAGIEILVTTDSTPRMRQTIVGRRAGPFYDQLRVRHDPLPSVWGALHFSGWDGAALQAVLTWHRQKLLGKPAPGWQPGQKLYGTGEEINNYVESCKASLRREGIKVTQQNLATRCGCSQQIISVWQRDGTINLE